MKRDEIVTELFKMRDVDYAQFQGKLIPTVSSDGVIGVRTPALRAFAKDLYKDQDIDEFLCATPHQYFDEDQLHAFVISLEKDFDKCIALLEEFLPFIDNWATCDQLSPKCFKKEQKKLLSYIKVWIKSNHTYTVRFAIGMLMQHYLDDGFKTEYADMVAEVRSDEYYINMMIAWYFATALAKQYESIVPYIEERRLAVWVHNKAIQKSVESYRITAEQKEYLKTLKIK
jgi:hypothetical protein